MKKERKIKNWVNETAKDTLALGSLAFFVMVIARALIGPFWVFAYQLIISSIALLIFGIFIKYEKHLARAFVLAIIISAFYNVNVFTIFSALIFMTMLLFAVYLNIKSKSILKGLFIGAISSAIGYYLASPLANLLNLTI